MNYTECIALIDFLGKRVRELGLPPMYQWKIPNTWAEYRRWAVFLGYKEAKDGMSDITNERSRQEKN